jgi:predicted O-methyltransferase YrrM
MFRKLKNVTRKHPRGLKFQLPKRSLADIFPGIENVLARLSLAHIPNRADMVMPLKETLVIAAICQSLRPRRAFEIGTFTGTTTLAIAFNSPEDAEIFTLDLQPQTVEDSQIGIAFRRGNRHKNIRQLYGESTSFDFEPYHLSMDLVLIDANHQYEFVKRDTATALKMIKPGGVIVWDDYLWDKKYPECAGVTRFLDELLADYTVTNISDTRLAICRF